MRPKIALLGLALILFSTQLASAQAATCDNIWIDAEDVTMDRDDTEYFYFPIYNDYDEEFVDFSGAIVSSSLADLPTPSASNIGQLYYVIADAKFYYSDGTQYVFIDLTGPSGSNGANGTDGVSITWQG